MDNIKSKFRVGYPSFDKVDPKATLSSWSDSPLISKSAFVIAYVSGLISLLIKGESLQDDNVAFGSTLSNDGYPTLNFDFMLSNPPYGKSWKTDLERLGGKSDISDPRFIVTHDGELDFKMCYRTYFQEVQ